MARLTGIVQSSSGQRLAGATVTVTDGPDLGRDAQTNGSGVYQFDNLTIGNTNFVARASGFLEDRRGVFVNGTNTLDFSLSPAPTTLTITSSEVSRAPGSSAEWRFVASGANVPPSRYNWDFGDGNGATNSFATEQHVYTTPGDYTVRVTNVPIGGGTGVTATTTVSVRF